MCRVGGPRCENHPDRSHQRYARNTRFRQHLLTELQYHGVDPTVDTDIDFHSASVSALPLIAQAAGLNPNSVLSRSELVGTVPGTVNPRVTDRDREIVAAVEKAYVPSPQRVMESVVNDPSRQEVLHAAAYGMFSAKDKVRELRENNAEHRELKRACVREIEMERKFAESMNMYMDDIQFAVRGAEFVPRADMDSIQPPEGVSVLPEDTPVDPAFITPLRAMGLSDRTNSEGVRKPLSDRGRDASLAAAGRRTHVPKHDTRADELCLAQVGNGVERVGALIGDETQNSYVDAIQRDDEGTVRAAVLCAGPLDTLEVPDDIRARALYAAHVIGSPEAVVTAVIRGKPSVLRLNTETAVLESGVADGKGTMFSQVIGNVSANREEMKRLSEQPRAFRREMDGNEQDDVRDAENNLAALLPHIPANEVKKELAKRRGEEGKTLDAAVREMIAEKFDRSEMGTLCGVDGETAGATNDKRGFEPEYSEWIETGIVRRDADGNEARFEKLHGVHPRILALNGTGAENIHGISPVMLEGKSRFDDDHEDVKRELLEGDVFVAHNARFEKTHLGAVLPEVVNGDRPWLDTQWLATHFLPPSSTGKGRTGLRLQHFVEDTGGTYEGAHRAGADAAMMMDALRRFFDRPNWWNKPE